MAKKDLKLLVKPEKNKKFSELDFVWSTFEELKSYEKKGFVRAKKLKNL